MHWTINWADIVNWDSEHRQNGTETVEHSEQVNWVYKYESTANITAELNKNPESVDKARKAYIDIDEPNGSYKMESAMMYTSPKGDRAVGESKLEKINITGSMYDDFHSWGE